MIEARAEQQPQHRLKLVVAYDGRGFSGSQRQPGKRTVQGELESAAAELFGATTQVSLAGRTDSGVHALGQVASCLDHRPDLSDWQVVLALRAHLADDVSVRSAERKPPDFDPRRHAEWRHYRYKVWNGAPNPLLRDWAAQVEIDLDPGAMRLAARSLIGEQDFASFAGLGKGVPWSGRAGRGTVRRVWAIEIAECREMHGRTIAVDVIGDAFLPGQVRSMVGALIEIGRRQRDAEWLVDLIARRDRRAGPKPAPAHGLVLWQVGYEPFTGAHVGSGTSDVERVQG